MREVDDLERNNKEDLKKRGDRRGGMVRRVSERGWREAAVKCERRKSSRPEKEKNGTTEEERRRRRGRFM